MQKYDVVLLDLDGTLTDSMEGIAKSVQYALSHFGIIEEDWRQLKHFVGPPLQQEMMAYYGFDEEKAQAAVVKYRERFSTIGLFENKPYQGIRQALSRLKAEGKTLALATSKPEKYARQIVEHFDLAEPLSLVAGSLLDGSRSKKAEVIAYALNQLGVKDKSRVVMVGDRIHDMEGAKANGIDAIGVLYGYGTMEEFSDAVAVAKTPEDLANILL